MKVALIHERIKNIRLDYLHKVTTSITKSNDYDTICLEDLDVKGMMQDKSVAKSIADAGWSIIKSQLTYKSEWYGKNLLFIDRFDPSSKTCSCCGKINRDLKRSDKKWTCKGCNVTHDRDINAAINIKTFALDKRNLTLNQNKKYIEPIILLGEM